MEIWVIGFQEFGKESIEITTNRGIPEGWSSEKEALKELEKKANEIGATLSTDKTRATTEKGVFSLFVLPNMEIVDKYNT